MKSHETSRPVLLLVDDEPPIRAVITRFAERYCFDIIACADGREAIEVVKTHHIDVALIDVRLPHVGGMEILTAIRGLVPECQVILMTGSSDIASAIEAIRLGAMDYLSKPINFDRLSELFTEVCEIAIARATASPAAEVPVFHGMIGASTEMTDVVTAIRRLAPYARMALITGETGTGKELAARALHAVGPRAAERLVTINCSALVETLFESELFGHVKGAFTGASADKPGLFEEAHRGTLFLDEIGELPLAMQSKLLRVLEGGELLRVGALTPRLVDVHVIAATSRNLRAEVAAGRFRQDLLFRINMIEIPLPPLRARRDDILPLARAFLARFSVQVRKNLKDFAPRAEAALRGAQWPGNVRQLRNVVERACIVADGEVIDLVDLTLATSAKSPAAASGVSGGVGAAPVVRRTLAGIEREQMVQALADSAGNKAKAADALGISRRAFYRRLERHGLAEAIHRRSATAEVLAPLRLLSAPR
jgi:DNA-binding NtrC family response regulator